jgi:hypothetical protein
MQYRSTRANLNPTRLSNWFRYIWSVSSVHESCRKDINGLVYAAFFGDIINIQILESSYLNPALLVGPSLYWASRKWHAKRVEALLEQTELDCETSYANGQSPLLAAREYGRLECVVVLTSSAHFNVNETGSRGCRLLPLRQVPDFSASSLYYCPRMISTRTVQIGVDGLLCSQR